MKLLAIVLACALISCGAAPDAVCPAGQQMAYGPGWYGMAMCVPAWSGPPFPFSPVPMQ